ncbi:hypothetical protein L3Q82_013739, partial [Scortum barcoo]
CKLKLQVNSLLEMGLPTITQLLGLISLTVALDNGLLKTPPMGWMAWERFRCDIDCKDDPENCIREDLFRDMADRLVEDGWKELGYEYVIIDDCWMSMLRDEKGRLQPEPSRFPGGIAQLARYIHDHGLKLGIYADMGSHTCMGFPGTTLDKIEIDAQTFASWGVDYLKFDGCNSNPAEQILGYPLMSKALNATGRPMAYSCSWPVYVGGLPPDDNLLHIKVSKTKELMVDFRRRQREEHAPLSINGTTVERVNSFRFLGVHISEDLTWTHHTDFITKSARQRLFFLRRLRRLNMDSRQLLQVHHREYPDWLHHHLVNYSLLGDICHLWRNYFDIQDSWDSVQAIIEWFSNNQDDLQPAAGPGRWNDPDMLIIGNYGLSLDQARSQMALWAIMAAPLIMSNDLRNLDNSARAILQNKVAIAINQDPMGIQGRRLLQEKSYIEVYWRPLSHSASALVFLSRRTDMPYVYHTSLSKLNYDAGNYEVNKMDEMNLRIVSAKIDSCVAIVIETWLDNNIPDVAVELAGRFLLRADRTAASEKHRGGAVYISQS